jgi:hypothetical protein
MTREERLSRIVGSVERLAVRAGDSDDVKTLVALLPVLLRAVEADGGGADQSDREAVQALLARSTPDELEKALEQWQACESLTEEAAYALCREHVVKYAGRFPQLFPGRSNLSVGSLAAVKALEMAGIPSLAADVDVTETPGRDPRDPATQHDWEV